MHSSAHSHPHPFGKRFDWANAALTLLVVVLFFLFLLLLLTVVAETAYAQNSTPPTARQAATMPQFAASDDPRQRAPLVVSLEVLAGVCRECQTLPGLRGT